MTTTRPEHTDLYVVEADAHKGPSKERRGLTNRKRPAQAGMERADTPFAGEPTPSPRTRGIDRDECRAGAGPGPQIRGGEPAASRRKSSRGAARSTPAATKTRTSPRQRTEERIRELGEAVAERIKEAASRGYAAERRGISALAGRKEPKTTWHDYKDGLAHLTFGCEPLLHEITNALESLLGRFADADRWREECAKAVAWGTETEQRLSRAVITRYTADTRKRLGGLYASIEASEIAGRIRNEAEQQRHEHGLVQIDDVETTRELSPGELTPVLEAIRLNHTAAGWWGWRGSGTERQERRRRERQAVRAVLIDASEPQTIREVAAGAGLEPKVALARASADSRCRRAGRGRWELAPPGPPATRADGRRKRTMGSTAK